MPSPRDSHSSLREPKGIEWNIQAQKTPSQEGVIVDYENEWEHPKQGTGAAGGHRVDGVLASLVDDVFPVGDVLAVARRAAQEPAARVGLVELDRGPALILEAGRRRGDKPPPAAVGRHPVDQLPQQVGVEHAQLIDDDDLACPHQPGAAFLRRDHLQTPARARCPHEGRPLRRVGCLDGLILAETPPTPRYGPPGCV